MHNYHSRVNLTKHDIIPLANYTWKHSFAFVESNHQAAVTQGWNLLNCNLLNNIELKGMIGTLNPSGEDIIDKEELVSNNLNFRSGFAGCAVFDLLQLARRDTNMLKKLEESKKDWTTSTRLLEIIKQLTAGILYRMVEVVLDPECIYFGDVWI